MNDGGHDRAAGCALRMALAMLLLIAQASAWAGVFAFAPDDSSFLPICHSADAGEPGPGEQKHHQIDCGLCVRCAGVGVAAVLPMLMAETAPRVRVAMAAAALPPARGPPTATIRKAAFPTGPPALT